MEWILGNKLISNSSITISDHEKMCWGHKMTLGEKPGGHSGGPSPKKPLSEHMEMIWLCRSNLPHHFFLKWRKLLMKKNYSCVSLWLKSNSTDLGQECAGPGILEEIGVLITSSPAPFWPQRDGFHNRSCFSSWFAALQWTHWAVTPSGPAPGDVQVPECPSSAWRSSNVSFGDHKELTDLISYPSDAVTHKPSTCSRPCWPD